MSLTAQERQITIRPDALIPIEFMGESRPLIELSNENVEQRIRPGGPVEREDREHEMEERRVNPRVNENALPQGIDPALQTALPLYSQEERGLDLSVNGEPYTGVVPADQMADVGPNHVIQMINNSSSSYLHVYDKSLVSMASHSLLSALTGVSGGGDPVVLYDALADRWLISEFGASGNRFLVAVSTTSNPLGTWYTYNYTLTQFPDYPKYAVWNNMYIVTSNESTPAIYALPRANMLAGTAGTIVRFSVATEPTIAFEACTPVNYSGGTAPPAGAPGMFMRMTDDGWGAGLTDRLELWNINYNSLTPGSSTITGPTLLGATSFDSNLCGYNSISCIPMPGTATTMDPIIQVLMNRIQYRNLAGYETIVCDHSVDVGGDHAGIRWYELHRTGGIANAWGIYQQGTYAPDAAHRWMGAIAINANGDIGLSYNVSSSSVFPSIRYTGRYASDPLGQMTIAETSIVAGAAYNNSNRWGDYASLDVDPSDGTSFYGTAGYNPVTSPTHQWATRIFKFSFTPLNVRISPKVFLEGPYVQADGLMYDSLRVHALIPPTEPFTGLGYTHFGGGGGETTTNAVLNVTGNNAIVDWVVVELRNSANSATIVATKSALLQRDRDVVATDGVSPVTFTQSAGNFYVAVRHRNHFGTMTATAIALTNAPVTVDFTLLTTAVYGANARKDVGGTQVLWAGDVVWDHTILYTGTNNDRDPILVRIGGTVPTNTVSGYFSEDVNLSGVVMYTGAGNDRDPILVNIGGTVPTNSITEQVP